MTRHTCRRRVGMLLVSLRLLLMCCCVLWRCWGVLIPYLAPDQVRARGGTKEAACAQCALQQLGTGITDNHDATPPSSSCTQLSSAQAGLENNTVISHTVLSLIHHGTGKNFSRNIFVICVFFDYSFIDTKSNSVLARKNSS